MIVGSIGYILSLGATALAFYTQSHLVESDGGAFVREISQTGGWVVFISLLVFIASHAFGQGAVIWVFISEIFPTRVRARGQGARQFHSLDICRRHQPDFPLDSGSLWRPYFCFLLHLYGRAVGVGTLLYARN